MPSPWLNSNPEGEISLFYIDRLMIDCFSPTFPSFFLLELKTSKKRENFNFLLVGFILVLSSGLFLSGIEMGANYLVIDWKTLLGQ